ncbi:MAG: hypothetical protein HDQ88_09985 [Clostridia bacterium]|nr:hypothetical protein [Clostridia bacterium]
MSKKFNYSIKPAKDYRPITEQTLNGFQRFLAKPNIEKSISIIFPIILAIIIGFATNSSVLQDVVCAIILWFIAGIVLAIFIILLFVCWHYQKVQNNNDDYKAREINEHFGDLGSRLNKYISSYLYDNYPLIGLGKGELGKECFIEYSKLNSFKHIWQNICEDIKTLIKVLKFSKDENNFGVNIIARLKKEDEIGYFMPVFDYTERVDSRSCLTSEFQKEKELKTPYEARKSPYYLKFFADSRIRAEILKTKKEFEDNFKDYNGNYNYNQIISIPIIYKNTTVAVIQLIGYEKSEILDPKKDKSELLREINNYFFIYEKLALLTLILGLKSN